MSSPNSPANEVNSIPESAGYFPRHRRDTVATNTSTILSGDEADTDGEPRSRGKPRIRDFQDEKEDKGRRSSIFSKGRKHKHSKKNKSGRKKKRGGEETSATITESPTEYKDEGTGQIRELAGRTTTPHVGFAPIPDNVQSELPSQQVSTSAPRRPFAITRSSFRPPIPNVFANTVFTTPPPVPTKQLPPGPLSLARGTQLRRTNSLPGRLSSQTSRHPAILGTAASVRNPDASAINEADAIGKDRTEDDKPPPMSRTAAVMLLLCSTGLVAFCADLLVDAIPKMVENTPVSEAFIGLIILPIVGNAAEHVTAVAMAAKNKMDLAIGIAVGSSIQIALFITPVVVLLGWILDKEMSLLFTLFETISLFVTVFVVNFLVLDGRSNYLEGSLLIAAYTIIALAAYFYPSADNSSPIGGGSNEPQALLSTFR